MKNVAKRIIVGVAITVAAVLVPGAAYYYAAATRLAEQRDELPSVSIITSEQTAAKSGDEQTLRLQSPSRSNSMTNLKNPTHTDTTAERPPVDDYAIIDEVVREKLIDAQTPGYQAEFDDAGRITI